VQKEAIAQVGKPQEGEAIYMRWNIAQEWAREATKEQPVMTTDTIPEEYRQHAKVFSEEELKWFPSAWEEDMTVQLREDVPVVINCKVYPLTKEERQTLRSFWLGTHKRGTLTIHFTGILHQ